MTCEDRRVRRLLGDEVEWTAHRATCAACAAETDSIDAVRRALGDAPVPVPPSSLTATVEHAVQPLLAAHAAAARRLPRLSTAVLVSMLPLPILIPLNLLFLWGLNAALSTVLPAPVSTALVVGQATLLSLLMAFTYASVPLLADRQRRALLEEAR